MMACKRRSDNLSLVKYGHSKIIRGERATRLNTTLAQVEETGRERPSHLLCRAVRTDELCTGARCWRSWSDYLQQARDACDSAETDVLPRERCARSERRSVSERLTTMSCSGSRITHTHKDPGMPMEMQRDREMQTCHTCSACWAPARQALQPD
jgi:hypothetical protein